ncbi:hypothetical protein COLO4_36168 [Corchorus olitorius]|uniref:Uncharacterized protein n=1 Tax=Corchorus olitorius TaxID=93759 RepID=A0A1R3GAR8_9ROSI|nr:hypothetical protein COLO4_36168 [Corchorus olitorius]
MEEGKLPAVKPSLVTRTSLGSKEREVRVQQVEEEVREKGRKIATTARPHRKDSSGDGARWGRRNLRKI